VSAKTTRQVDILQDVFRSIPLRWSATEVGGLPLKVTSSSHGIFYEPEMYQMLQEIYSFIYLVPESSFRIPQRARAKDNATRLLRFIKITLMEAKGGITAGIVRGVLNHFIRDVHGGADSLAQRLVKNQPDIDILANDLLAVIVTASVELPQIFAHVVNFYLQKKNELHLGKITGIVSAGGSDALLWLSGYVREALRLDPFFPGVYRDATEAGGLQTAQDSFDYLVGTPVFLSLSSVANSATYFPKPAIVDPTRAEGDYVVIQGDAAFKVLGADFVYTAAAQVLRAIFSLKNVRKSSDKPGLSRFPIDVHGTPQYFYQDANQRLTPFANRFIIAYDP